MKPTTTSLAEMLHSTAVAQEQPPLLSRGEILEILRETDNKKAAAPLLLAKPILLPRILKFSAVGLSAAAVLMLFIWKTGDNGSVPLSVGTHSEANKPLENTAPSSPDVSQQREKTSEQPLHETATNSQHTQTTTPTIAHAEQQGLSTTAPGRGASPSAIIVMADDNATAKTENAEMGGRLSDESAMTVAAIATPEHIDPILGKRINDVETALGITFDAPSVASTSSRPADTPKSNSLSRSLVPESNSLWPKPSTLVESKRSGGYADTHPKNTEKSLLETLRDASAEPQMITLIQDGKVVANEWNFGASSTAKTDNLLPVYVSLKGKNIASGKADYALLWLPPSSPKAAQANTMNLAVTPNPVEANSAYLTLSSNEEMIVSIAIYDMFGKKNLEVVQSEKISKGQSNRELSLENLSDGVYTVVVVGAGSKELASCRFVIEKVREK